MSNKFKEIHIKNRTCCFFDEMINIKNLEAIKIKIDKKPYKHSLIYYIGYVTGKDLSYAKISSVNRLYLIDKINLHIEESSGYEYLTLVRTDESKETLKKYQELWTKIKDLTRSITNNLDNYEEKI